MMAAECNRFVLKNEERPMIRTRAENLAVCGPKTPTNNKVYQTFEIHTSVDNTTLSNDAKLNLLYSVG